MSDEEIVTEILEKVASGIPILIEDYEFVVEMGFGYEMNELKKKYKREHKHELNRNIKGTT